MLMEEELILNKLYIEFPKLLDLHTCGDDEDPYMQYPFDKCYTVLNPDSLMAEVDIAAGLIICGGNYSDVARLLRRSRTSVQYTVVRNANLKDIRDEHKEVFLDRVEQLHMQLALKGDGAAQKFFLTTLGEDRGYVTRKESTGPNGGPIQHITGDMSPEEAADAYEATLDSQ